MANLAFHKEENLLPLLRANVATKLFQAGFRAKEIAEVLNVTPSAVTQYLKGKRGNAFHKADNELVVKALVDKAAQRIRSGIGGLTSIELLEAAYQILSADKGLRKLEDQGEGIANRKSVGILRQRLQLELKAAEKCLDLAGRTRDEYTKLLLRMIASDSIRHADIVSQVVSWLEKGGKLDFEPPAKEFLDEVLEIEDKAGEVSLSRTIRIPHRGAMLLLESIDMDETKHDRLIEKMVEAGTH